MKIVCSLLLGIALGGLHCRADVLYGVTELKDPPGSTDLQGSSINNAGQVVGTGVGQYSGIPYAFLYSDGQVSDMGTLGNATSLRYGSAINNAGQATGASNLISIPDRHAFLYSNGQMTDIGALNGPLNYSFGNAISDNGQITGCASAILSSDHGFLYHAFLYANGTMRDLGSTAPGGNSYGLGVNNAGQVTGDVEANGHSRAFLYSSGEMTDLGTFGGTDSIGYAINNSGQVAGVFYTAQGAHAFLYSEGQILDLGSGVGRGINNLGQVVGDGALLYTNGQVVDLNTEIDPALGIHMFRAEAINDIGQIVALRTDRLGEYHTVILTPVPESSTLACVGLAVLIGCAGSRLKNYILC